MLVYLDSNKLKNIESHVLFVFNELYTPEAILNIP